MKKIMKSFALLAVAALGLSACTGEKLVPDNGNADGKFVTVHFGAEAAIEGATKATLITEDEKTFKSAWVDGDALSVEYSNDNETVDAITSGVISATWTTDHFEANLPKYRGVWFYDALYPAPNAEKKVDFGSARTQNGSDYNSKYDLMKGGAIAENADAGKTADGQNIVFNMTRQTAIAYFHLTSTLDEEVVSAKLSVEGNGAYLSTSDVQIGKDNKGNTSYAQGYAFTETEGVASKEISLTFTGTAPKTSDFKLWFNVLPTNYDKMTLTVETANHTLTISRTAADNYAAGKLYKVVKTISADKWVKKGGETPSTKDFTLVTSALSDWTGSYLLVGEYSTETTPKSSYYAYDESIVSDKYSWGKCSEVVVDNNTIASTYGTMALEIVPGTTANTYSIMTPSGKYLSASAAKKFNLSETYSADNCDFAISFGDKNEIIIQASSLTLEEAKHRQIRYNYNNGNGGFRWYEGLSVDPVYLYKGPSVAKYSVSYGTVEGGSFSASPSKAEAGAEITLTATPAEGYAFNNDWSVKGVDETVIEVVTANFIMPAQNVTVSGTFSKVIPLPTCATPVITIAEGGVVSITCDTAGATIHYTVGDAPADPTETDAVFSTVTLTDGQTIKAIAVAEGFKPSAVASKKYVVGGSALVDKTATIKFGKNNVEIIKDPVTANDDQNNSWTITTVGTTFCSQQSTYSQVGSSNNPATSITFITTLPEDAEVTSISAKFGGFNSTAGTVTLKVGETSVGTGKLNAKNDVTVTSTSTAVGNKVTITVTGIAKGVKCYNIQVKYKTAN